MDRTGLQFHHRISQIKRRTKRRIHEIITRGLWAFLSMGFLLSVLFGLVGIGASDFVLWIALVSVPIPTIGFILFG